MNISKWLSGNKSGILSLVACVGVVVTTVLTFKGAIKAKETMDEWTEEKHDELTTIEKIQASAKPMIGAVVSGAATIGLIAGAQKVNKEQIALLAGSAAAITKRYDDYRKANIKVNGMDAHERVMKELEVQKAKQTNITSESMFQITTLNSKLSKEQFLFHDEITDEYFEATLAQVLDAINALNRNFTMCHPEVDVHMWCDFLGIKNRKKDTRGWVFCDGCQWLDFNISDPMEVKDGVKVITISPVTSPIEDYLNYDWMGDCYYDDDGNKYDFNEIVHDEMIPF